MEVGHLVYGGSGDFVLDGDQPLNASTNVDGHRRVCVFLCEFKLSEILYQILNVQIAT